MANKAELIAVLDMVLRDRPRRKEHVSRFQKAVWDEVQLRLEQDTETMLRDLAYDLDYYEPDGSAQKEDPSYFGDDRLEEEVRTVLSRLSDD